MRLLTMKELLNEAVSKNKAVAAINFSNMETLMALLEVAENQKAPLIIQIAPVQLETQKVTYEQITAMVKLFGKSYDANISLHLDHALKVEDCYKAIDAGFSSVMYDGSLENYECNLKNTKKVVEYAKLFDVTVEAELGKVGGTEGVGDEQNNGYMTDPSLVKDFIDFTNVDCLAISIGNAHGLYKSEPNLDFQRLKEIEQIAKIPLVLHGGTGIPDYDIDKAIELGIRKINFFTEIDRAFVNGFIKAYNKNNNIYMMAAQESGRQTMMKEIEKKIILCERRSKK